MDRFGGRARLTGLGSLGFLLALLVVVAGGCSGSSSARTDPPAKAKPVPATIAPVKRNLSLPGADVSKARDGGGGDLRRVHFYDRALGQADSYLIYLPQGYANQAKSGAAVPGPLSVARRRAQRPPRRRPPLPAGADRPGCDPAGSLRRLPPDADRHARDDRQLGGGGHRVGQHVERPLRVGGDRLGSIGRFDLADGAQPLGTGDRRPLDGRLRRGQHRAAPPEPLLGGGELVRLLHPDAHRAIRGGHAGARCGPTARLPTSTPSGPSSRRIRSTCSSTSAEPTRCTCSRAPSRPGSRHWAFRSRRTNSAGRTTSPSGRTTWRWR